MGQKKKLIWHIFPSFLIITLLSLSAVTYYSSTYFKNFFLKNSEQELTNLAIQLQDTFSRVLRSNSEGYSEIDRQCKTIGAKTRTRVTVILPSGKVIGDSFSETETMENHMKRPEIKEALKKKKGVSTRYSATLDKNMMYIALPVILDNSVIAVVRTSLSVTAIDSEINSVRNKIMIAMFFTVLAAAVASLIVSRRITRPIEQMKTGALKFSTGNLNTRLAVPDSEELSELAIIMNRMASNLADKIKDVQDRSMELEAVHASMQEGVIAIDKDEKIITINKAAARILDFPEDDHKSRYVLEAARNVEFQSFIQRALATHEPVEDDIVISRDQDLVLNIHSTALYDAGKNRMGTLIIFHDITRLRRLETMHKDFAANVSHELKTPLTTIKGFIETLEATIQEKDADQSAAFLKIIDKNVNRMIDLINDLLALSRLERLKGTQTKFEPQQISAILQGVVNACHGHLESRGIQVEIDCPEHFRINADPLLMEQALINLVVNAANYSPEDESVFIRASQSDRFIHISIKDNGVGIEKEHQEKIFNRFYRVDKARSRKEGGTGLGLAIVKHIVQYHNGRIEVESQKGSGSIFTISIPE